MNEMEVELTETIFLSLAKYSFLVAILPLIRHCL